MLETFQKFVFFVQNCLIFKKCKMKKVITVDDLKTMLSTKTCMSLP